MHDTKSLNIQGIINIYSVDSSGKRKNYPKIYNTITTYFIKYLACHYRGSTYYEKAHSYVPSLAIGKGSGSIDSSSVALFIPNNNMGSYVNSCWVGSSRRRQHYADDLSYMDLTFYYVVGATQRQTGTITEIGLGGPDTYGQEYLITHSLLKDAEGHPYSIDKKENESLTFEYTIRINFYDSRILDAMLSGTKTFTQDVYVDGVLRTMRFYAPKELIGMGNYNSSVSQVMQSHSKPRIKDKIIMVSAQVGLLSFYDVVDGSSSSYSDWDPESSYNNGNVVAPVRRIPQGWKYNRCYINGFRDTFRNWIHTYLPDYDIFPPTRTLRHQVAVGDGQTTEFMPPLEKWIENSERIFIDGVQLSRNVDYTCDNENNWDFLPELLPLRHASIIQGELQNDYDRSARFEKGHTYVYNYDIPICPQQQERPENNQGSVYTVNPNPYIRFQYFGQDCDTQIDRYEDTKDYEFGYVGLSSKNPLIFEFLLEDPVCNWNVDEVYLYWSHNWSWCKFTISCSDNLTDWIIVLDKVNAYVGYTKRTGYNYPIDQWVHYTLDQTYLKRYWKVEITPYSESGASDAKTAYKTSNESYNDTPLGIILRQSYQPIKFTNPPALGSIIEMDAQIDRPYKDENYLVDYSYSYTVTA